MSSLQGPLPHRLVTLVMKTALQHQGMLLGLPKTGTRSLSGLQGLSKSAASSKLIKAHPRPSSRKVAAPFLARTCCRTCNLFSQFASCKEHSQTWGLRWMHALIPTI